MNQSNSNQSKGGSSMNPPTNKDFGKAYDDEFKGVAKWEDFDRMVQLLQTFADAGVDIDRLLRWLAYKQKPYITVSNHAPDDSVREVVRAFRLGTTLKTKSGKALRDGCIEALLRHVHYSTGQLSPAE
jgi:hypothetical protein